MTEKKKTVVDRVGEFLRVHTGREFTPNQIAQELGLTRMGVQDALYKLEEKHLANRRGEKQETRWQFAAPAEEQPWYRLQLGMQGELNKQLDLKL